MFKKGDKLLVVRGRKTSTLPLYSIVTFKEHPNNDEYYSVVEGESNNFFSSVFIRHSPVMEAFYNQEDSDDFMV